MARILGKALEELQAELSRENKEVFEENIKSSEKIKEGKKYVCSYCGYVAVNAGVLANHVKKCAEIQANKEKE
jgi:rubrerythrin